MDRWWQLCQVCGLIVACKKSHNELNHGNTLHRHRHHHHSNTGSCHSNRAEAGGARAAVVKQQQEVDARTDGGTSEEEDEEEEEETPATKWCQEKDGGRKRKREEEEEVKLIRVKEEDGGEEEDVKKEVTEQPQRPRRRMVGPPIRYLLESEEQSHGLGVKHARKSEAGGGASEDMSVIDRSEDAGQTGWTNQDTVNKPKKQGRGCLKKAVGVSRHLQSGQLTLISPCCVRLQRLL
ncbi:sarcoplasmic reticulum histidine-rich calcium-binding protein-like [Thunnus maccoyii]|nr:sarcoplasmic reticulum histidine-rich calcium-binding protein-like [Thunnus maccoyii]